MPELVADCSRCGAKKITFECSSDNQFQTDFGWRHWYETFCICRGCGRATTFVLTNKEVGVDLGPAKFEKNALNSYFDNQGHIGLKDEASVGPPEHVPAQIEAIFREGATCLAVGCFNAAGTMFRLCVDLVTYAKLPVDGFNGMPADIRKWLLGQRLNWLFDKGILPADLRELSNCIKDDGNDGAHGGTLKEADATDLCDFTVELLERLYTEPKKLELAKERRDKRHASPANSTKQKPTTNTG